MAPRLRPPSSARLDDPKLEEVRRETMTKIVELQKLPSAALDVIPNIKLEDGIERTVEHGLGRLPRYVRESCVRGGATVGVVEEVRGNVDRTRYIVLKATGYGATITVDLAVM